MLHYTQQTAFFNKLISITSSKLSSRVSTAPKPAAYADASYAEGKCVDQIDGVMRQFAQDKNCTDEHIRKGNELNEAAYRNAIESVQSTLNNSDASLTDGHIHHSVDDMYEYFIKKSISFLMILHIEFLILHIAM